MPQVPVYAIKSVRRSCVLALFTAHHRLLCFVQAERILVGHKQLGRDLRTTLIFKR